MTEYIALEVLLLGVTALGLLVWLAYLTGKSNASVTTAQAGTASAMTQKAKAMLKARRDKPAIKDAVMARLDGGST